MTEQIQIRVLLADDVPDIRNMLQIVIERDPRFKVVAHAGDGEAAVGLAGEHKPDLVILDISMPKLNGLQAIPEIRKVNPGCRILIFSGFEAQRVAAKAIALCADAYIEKGHSLKGLTETLAMIHASPAKACAFAV
jgi:DNA-binding NarL/FixJ family response regulator